MKQDLRCIGVPEETILKNLVFCESAESAADQAHGTAVLTEWDEFKALDWKAIYDGMFKPAFLFDGRNILDRIGLKKIGFEIYSVGRG
jgi:UDPglucose 6-dehydrogenase